MIRYIKINFLILTTLSGLFSQAIIITDPKTNAVIPERDQIKISWKVSNLYGEVLIQYNDLSDRDNKWNTIDIVDASDSKYYWLPNRKLPGRVLIRISAMTNLQINDVVAIGKFESEKIKMSVDNIYPKTGEKITISWDTRNTVKVYYSFSGSKMIKLGEKDLNSFKWKVPEFLAGKAVTIYAEESGNEKNNDLIVIMPTDPKRGTLQNREKLNIFVSNIYPEPGETLKINWNISKPVNIYYTVTGGSYLQKKMPIKTNVTNKPFRWYIPSYYADKKIEIKVAQTGNSLNNKTVNIKVQKSTQSTKVQNNNTEYPYEDTLLGLCIIGGCVGISIAAFGTVEGILFAATFLCVAVNS